jgi:nucleoside-diphosphate-sugar epimerase
MLNNDNLCLGDPSPIRDFMFIDDHVNGYLRAIGNNAAVNRAFNICSGVGITIEKYVELISGLIGWKGKVTWGTVPNRPNDITCLIGDNHKIWDILGWKQTVSLETGLKKTIEMLKEKKQNG